MIQRAGRNARVKPNRAPLDELESYGAPHLWYPARWRGADASLRHALELAPGDAVVLRRAGYLANAQGRLEDAIGPYRRALEQDPLSPAAYHNLGRLLQAAGSQAEAEGAFRRALELGPLRAATRGYLALTLLAQERGEEAMAEAAAEPGITLLKLSPPLHSLHRDPRWGVFLNKMRLAE